MAGLDPLWPDADGDGFGDLSLPPVPRCPEVGWTDVGLDCDDALGFVFPAFGGNPGGDELCDLLDNDCDGLVDASDPDVLDAAVFHLDSDGDGYGDPTMTVGACAQPSDAVADDGDCDDSDASLNPGATEIPGNGVDEDCDGLDSVVAVETAHTGDLVSPPDVDPPSDTSTPLDSDLPEGSGPAPRSTGCSCGGVGGPSLFAALPLVFLLVRRPREAHLD